MHDYISWFVCFTSTTIKFTIYCVFSIKYCVELARFHEELPFCIAQKKKFNVLVTFWMTLLYYFTSESFSTQISSIESIYFGDEASLTCRKFEVTKTWGNVLLAEQPLVTLADFKILTINGSKIQSLIRQN